MKKLVHVILTVAVLFGLGLTLWTGLRKQKEKPADEAEATAAPEGAEKDEEKAEDFVVQLPKEKWQLLDLDKAEPEKAELRPRRMAFGRVLDPTPIVALEGELAGDEAALAASSAENERTQKLLAAGESTSRKAAETAEAQFRADAIKLDGVRRRALIEWGPAFASLDAQARHVFVEGLVNGASALVRVDILPGEALTAQPKSARMLILGREEQPIDTTTVVPAADVDPKTQAQGFILRVDQPPFVLRPGMALTAWLELPEDPRVGFAIPRSAVIRHDGRTWVYVQEEEEKFVRKPVALDTPLDGDRGWFVVANGGGIKADDLLIVTGGESLLSEELKAQGGAEVD